MREFKLWHVRTKRMNSGTCQGLGVCMGCSGVSPWWWWHNFLSLPLVGFKDPIPSGAVCHCQCVSPLLSTRAISFPHPCAGTQPAASRARSPAVKGRFSPRHLLASPQHGTMGKDRSRSHQAVQQTWHWLFPAAEPGVPKSLGAPRVAGCMHAPVPVGCTLITNIPPGRRVSG